MAGVGENPRGEVGLVPKVWDEDSAANHARENGRTAVMVYQENDGRYTAYYDDGTARGHKIVATNPFKLDSMLDEAGAPRPRNLYLIGEKRG